MGQYYYPINADKKQFIYPHKFGDGFKLLEFGASGNGTMLGLAILLAVGNGRGGGDLHSENSIIGSWAGDRVMMLGDYAEPSDAVNMEMKTITEPKLKKIIKDVWGEKSDWEDISEYVIEALCEDIHIRDSFLDMVAWHDWCEADWYFIFTKEEIAKRRKENEEKKKEQDKSLRPDMIIG